MVPTHFSPAPNCTGVNATDSTHTKLSYPIPSLPYGFQRTVSFQPALFTIFNCFPFPESFNTGSFTPAYTRSYSSAMVISLRSSTCSAGGSSILFKKVLPLKDPPTLVFLMLEMSKYEWRAAWKSNASALPVFSTTSSVSKQSSFRVTVNKHLNGLSHMARV